VLPTKKGRRSFWSKKKYKSWHQTPKKMAFMNHDDGNRFFQLFFLVSGMTTWCRFFGGQAELRTFLRFLFRKQKFKRTFQCCQQKKQATLVVDVPFLFVPTSIVQGKVFTSKGKQREIGCFLYSFSSVGFFFGFCFFEEKKKVQISQKTEEKTRYITKTWMMGTAKQREKMKKNVVSIIFLFSCLFFSFPVIFYWFNCFFGEKKATSKKLLLTVWV
jgi:hypothetical protein